MSLLVIRHDCLYVGILCRVDMGSKVDVDTCVCSRNKEESDTIPEYL